MAAAAALALLIAFVPSRLSEFIRLGLQQLVESFLYAASHKVFEFALDYGLIQLYSFFEYGLLSPFE